MKTLTKVGSIAAGAVMLGAALSGAVSAGLDATGLDKSFFYDANYNPIIQIVVGEKGLAPDSVAAGSIAAVVGNLAYTTKSTTVALDPTAQGRVVLGVSARGAAGKYEQKSETGLLETYGSDFYDRNDGIVFLEDTIKEYERGEFVSYSLSCKSERTPAGLLKSGTYNNIHCLFCETLCQEMLENPDHDIEESIWVDYDSMKFYEDGLGSDDTEALVLAVPSKKIEYRLDTGEIPLNKIGTTSDTIDFEWRGKMILFGEEYYTTDVKGTDQMYLAKGKVLDGVTSEGFSEEYMGYKFKIDHLIYSAEFTVAGILLDVQKPDGTIVQVQVSKLANGIVDDVEVAGVFAEEADAIATASLLVYDTTSKVHLEDGQDMVLGGEEKKYWKVDFSTRAVTSGTNDITEYDDATTGTVLENITIAYRHSLELAEGESLEFPSTYVFKFVGYRTNDFMTSPCSGAGEGDIKIEKDEKYKCLISFTGDNGQRYDEVGMHQGPYNEGDLFILNGKVMKFYDADESCTQCNDSQMELKIEDELDGGIDKYTLNALTGSSWDFTMGAFEEATENDEDSDLIEPDSDASDSDVYISSQIHGTYILYSGGDLYIVDGNNYDTLHDDILGCWSTQIGTIRKIDEDGHSLYITAANENGTDDLNNDSGTTVDNATWDGDGTWDQNDTLFVIENEEGEYAVVDMYDRNFVSDDNTYYDETVKASDQNLPLDGDAQKVKLSKDEDTLLILPEGGDKITVDWGADRSINSVSICHPKENVYITTFIGTTEEETSLESVITKDKEGTEDTVGCCTYTVKEFSVTATATSKTIAETTVNPVTGTLVVSESAADLGKNMVVVGGPSVNSLASDVTADEIKAATGQYIVKKYGKKVIVAGYEAADTVDGGNALIKWLQANVH